MLDKDASVVSWGLPLLPLGVVVLLLLLMGLWGPVGLRLGWKGKREERESFAYRK